MLPKLFEVLDYRPTFDAAAINVPIGLNDTPNRPVSAVRAGSPRVRRLAAHPSASPASRVGRRCGPTRPNDDGRDGAVDDQPRPSASALAARKRRAEIQPFHARSWFSAHPDVSFTAMNGDEPLKTSPYHEDGRLERLELIRQQLPGRRRRDHPCAAGRARRRCTCCRPPRCCGPPGARRVGRSAGCRSTRSGTRGHADGNRPLTTAPDSDDPLTTATFRRTARSTRSVHGPIC